MEALNAKWAKAAHAKSFFFNRLLAICPDILYSVKASFGVYFCHDIFSSPLFKTSVVEIDDEANGEFHEDNRRLMSRSTFFNARQSVQLVLQTKVLPEECLKT